VPFTDPDGESDEPHDEDDGRDPPEHVEGEPESSEQEREDEDEQNQNHVQPPGGCPAYPTPGPWSYTP